MLHYLGTDVPIKNLADSTSPSVGMYPRNIGMLWFIVQ